MKTILIAFDVDGTLRCNCTETCRDVNSRVLALADLLSKLKNTKLIAWSGGGANYTRSFIDSSPKLQKLFGDRCYSKLNNITRNAPVPDIAIDDQQEFSLGAVNLIVREK